MDEKKYSISDVFQIVGRSAGLYFHGRTAQVVGDNNKTTTMDLGDFVLRAIAEEIANRWATPEEVTAVLEEGDYEKDVFPTGEMGGLARISGGGRRSRRSRTTRRRT